MEYILLPNHQLLYIPISTNCIIQPNVPVTLLNEAISQIVSFVTAGELNGEYLLLKFHNYLSIIHEFCLQYVKLRQEIHHYLLCFVLSYQLVTSPVYKLHIVKQRE
jgi:hypothetical protein